MASDLVLDAAPPVARARAGGGAAGPVARREASEGPREPGLAPDAPAHPGGVVEGRPPRHAAGEPGGVAGPLADAPGGLALEGPGGPDVGVREGGGRALAPGDRAADPEARLAGVGPGPAQQPARRREAPGVPATAIPGHPLAPAPDAAPRGGVRAAVAEPVPGPHTRPRSRVAPLAPVPAAVVGPGAGRPLAGGERLALRLPPGGPGERPSALAHLFAVGSDTPTVPAIDAIGSPRRAPLRMSPVLSASIIPPWPPHVASRGNDMSGRSRDGRRAHARARIFWLFGVFGG